MKRLLMLLLFIAFVSIAYAEKPKPHRMVTVVNTCSGQLHTYPEYSVRDIETVPLDSLLKADLLQGSNPSEWTLQRSPLYGDTVVVIGLVIAPAANVSPWAGLTYTAHGWTMLLHDTAANSNYFGGVLVRAGHCSAGFTPDCPDTAQAFTDGFTVPQRGNIVRMTVVVEEFPVDNPLQAQDMNSMTQLRPVPCYPVEFVDTLIHPIPKPTHLSITDFYEGGYPGGRVKYSTGEPYEASLVELTNLKVDVLIGTTHGNGFPANTWSMTESDGSGNSIADYDASHYFTYGNENPAIAGDPSFSRPPVFAVVDTIRGTMITISGVENPRGYRIAPLFTGDVVYGTSLPTIASHRRNPVTVQSTDTVQVTARVTETAGGFPISKAVLIWSQTTIGGSVFGPWRGDTMVVIDTANTFSANIWDFPDHNPLEAGITVRYYMKAIDDHGNVSILANSSPQFSGDTSKGFFFYKVKNTPYTIHDIQYTPYRNGRSPYLGGMVSVGGVVTASSNEMRTTQFPGLAGAGTFSWYIQDGNAPWSGIWVVKDSANNPALDDLVLGDSVVVTGTVQEQGTSSGEVTRINDSVFTVIAHGRPVPEPITIPTSTFQSSVHTNGDSLAEPYEGMLVRMVNTHMVDTIPYFSDPSEYGIDDGSGECDVRRDGVNTWSTHAVDTTLGDKILTIGDRIDTLIGIGWFSFGRYKIVPRTNADFVVGDQYPYVSGWNMISVPHTQMPASTGYHTSLLFPGATSSAFNYSAGYNTSTNVFPGIGYWLKFGSNRSIRQYGSKITADTIPLVTGWNMIGTIANPIATSSLVATPNGNTLSSFFGYSNGYTVVTTLNPTKGYWVKAGQNGALIENSAGAIPRGVPIEQQFNSLTISDRAGNSQTLYFGVDARNEIDLSDYEMPPLSPVEGFAVQYASGRILETYPAVVKDGREFPITFNASSGPLTVSWNVVGRTGQHINLSDAQNGKTMKTIELTGNGSFTGVKGGSGRLLLRVDGGNAIPREYALSQNYPNPFNPTTQVVVALPEASHLDVSIYNVLGQRVTTLVDEVREAGYHTIVWNGTTDHGLPVSSGVYFIRLNAQKAGSSADVFNAIRKVVMMK